MLRIAIDGATRRNGQPTCVAAGGVFVIDYDDELNIQATQIRSSYEHASTNQRGELLALLKALDYVHAAGREAQIITDSEYLFNAMTKNWCDKWVHNNWIGSTGQPVKNADLWREIHFAAERCPEITFFHIKGHVIPFGKVTANNLLHTDPTGRLLFDEALKKFDLVAPTKADNIAYAQDLSVKNNGFELEPIVLKTFVAANVVADAIATMVVDAADRKI